MIEWLDSLDRALLLYLNGLNNEFLDDLMFRLTDQLYWFPFFAIVLFVMFKKYRWQGIYLVLGIALTITFADQFTSRFMKPFFARFRPSHQPELEGLIHIVNGYKGGLYGFASSHAANSFGVSLFMYMMTRDRISWIWVMFVWAAIFSYTRIYLGVHYPGDILVGALVGMLMGYLCSILTNKAIHRFSPSV